MYIIQIIQAQELCRCDHRRSLTEVHTTIGVFRSRNRKTHLFSDGHRRRQTDPTDNGVHQVSITVSILTEKNSTASCIILSIKITETSDGTPDGREPDKIRVLSDFTPI